MATAAVSTFSLFIHLPVELRLRIWELLLPPRRDLKIGPRTHEETTSELGEVWTNKPPLTLLSTCRESRKVALDNGCFTSNPTQDPALASLVWIDRRPRAVYLPPTAASYSRACSLPIDIEAFAYLWPTVEGLHCLKQSLLDQPPSTQIRAIYIGLSGIIYDHPLCGVLYPDLTALPPEQRPPNPLYEGSNILVMDLDDVRLPALLECAHGMGQGTPRSYKFHQTSSCFLETLKLYWENNDRALQLREAWYGTTQDHGSDGAALDAAAVTSTGSQLGHIELKPAVIFGRTKQALFFGRNDDRRRHERSSGIVFSLRDIHYCRVRRRPPPYLGRLNYCCRTVCGGRMMPHDS